MNTDHYYTTLQNNDNLNIINMSLSSASQSSSSLYSTYYKEPIRVLITGATGQIAYSLIPLVASGRVFGLDQPVVMNLLAVPPLRGAFDGVVMELEDCASGLVHGIGEYVDEATAFKDIDAAFLVGSMRRRKGMERKDLLAANVQIFKSQGKALAKYSKANVKVLVVGNPANTNALIASRYAAPRIPAKNFSALTRLDQNRAAYQVAKANNIDNVNLVKNVIIWGNHSSTQFPDVSGATYMGRRLPFTHHDTQFIERIQKRGAAVIQARQLSSAMSAAKAAADHMRDWFMGTDDPVSMAVLSEGQYGSPKDVFFSMPVIIDAETREWRVDETFKLDDFAKAKIAITSKELLEERDEALSITE